jgi:hypothetical protein
MSTPLDHIEAASVSERRALYVFQPRRQGEIASLTTSRRGSRGPGTYFPQKSGHFPSGFWAREPAGSGSRVTSRTKADTSRPQIVREEEFGATSRSSRGPERLICPALAAKQTPERCQLSLTGFVSLGLGSGRASGGWGDVVGCHVGAQGERVHLCYGAAAEGLDAEATPS